jgi:hypothetical protein
MLGPMLCERLNDELWGINCIPKPEAQAKVRIALGMTRRLRFLRLRIRSLALQGPKQNSPGQRPGFQGTRARRSPERA